MVNALLYQLATGCQWRALPRCFPAVSTVRYYFYGWRDQGVFDAMIDALRDPVRVLEGRQEMATAALMETMPSVAKVFADGAYRVPKLTTVLAAIPAAPTLDIVRKPQGQQGFAVAPRRWVVERFFAWLGRCRRLAKDYERRVESSLAWLQLAVIRLLIRRLGRAETPTESVTY